MEPNQPQGHDPYAFIMDTSHKPKRNLLPNQNSPKQRLLVVGGGFVVLLVLLMIGFAIFSSTRSSGTKQLLGIAQTQNEIIRVSQIGVKDSRDSTTQAFSQSVSLSLTSSQKEVTDYLAKQGVKTKPKDLALKKSSATDATLETAGQASQFDQVFMATLTKQLTAYQKEVKTAYDQASNATLKKILQDSFNQVNTLLKNTQPATSS